MERKIEFDADRRCIVINGYYDFDIEAFTTCAEMLDGIMQIASKSTDFLSNENLGRIIRFIHIVLDPQATLCSGGHDRGPIKKAIVSKMIDDDGKSEWAQKALAGEDL